jgi:hypothetical protein
VDVIDLVQAQDVDILDADGQPAHDAFLDNLEVARASANHAGWQEKFCGLLCFLILINIEIFALGIFLATFSKYFLTFI